MKLLRRLRYLLNRSQSERDLHAEMDAHREMLTAERRTAFGSELRLREQSRDAWGFAWLDEFRQDLAYGIRQLRRSPGFTLTAIAVLALGIGAPLAMFNVVNAAMFHWLAVRDAEVLIEFTPPTSSSMIDSFRDHNAVLSYIVAERSDGSVFVEDDLEPKGSVFVSAGYFADLGVIPAQGRLLDPRDADPGATPVVVLGYAYWRRHFGSDSSVVGRIIHLNGKPVQIAGVLSPEFNGLSRAPGEPPALWLSIAAHPYLFQGSKVRTDLGLRDTQMYAKLKPGVTLPAAEAQLNSLLAELRTQHPDQILPKDAIHGKPLLELPHDALPILSLVTLLVMLVLVTACANLGNLLLARGQARAREIDTRIALGAGGSRIIRQLMAENLLLAALGAAAGLAVGYFAAKEVLRASGASAIHPSTDWKMVSAGVMLAIVAAVVFGLAPAIQTVRRAAKSSRTRKVLVAIQVAASCFLLILASVLALSARRQLEINVRFDYRHMVVIDPRLDAHGFAGAAARQMLDEMAARLEQVPGVAGVTSAVFIPFNGRSGLPDFRPGLPRISYNQVAPSYFDLMNLPLVRGHLYAANEQAVVVLSESTARAIWPADDPIGKSLDVAKFSIDTIEGGGRVVKGMIGAGAREQRTVIGIVKDSGSTRAVNALEGYMPIEEKNAAKTTLILRAAGDPTGIVQNARSAASLPDLVPAAWLMRTRAEEEAGPPPGVLLTLGSLSGTATSLAAVGIFGLIAFAVAQRTREIGVRMALGARGSNIVRTLLAQYSVSMSIGAAAGVTLAIIVGLLIRSTIIGVDPLDPLGYAAGLAIFATVALAAILIPAHRALRIDPASALRWE